MSNVDVEGLTLLIQNNDDAKVILANAVQHVKHSVGIWLAATELEQGIEAKQRVLRKGMFTIIS